LASYRKWGQKLVESGRAYADPYTSEEVQAFREQAQVAKKPFLYRDHRPDNPPAWDGSQPLRFKSEPKAYQWHDEVMGDLSAGPEVIDDFILIKSDGYPTYNFAHIIDDAEMEISHVIRGQEFLASVPNYLNLYEALDINQPKLATMPHILGPDGKKKLSKRDGAKDVLDYVRDGYLPEALVSFIATLGWNDGTEQEIFTKDELLRKFSLDRVQRSGAKFDERRLVWVNGHFIREMPLDELYKRAEGYWGPAGSLADESYKKQVLGLVQERLKYLAELPDLTAFFFEELPADMKLIDNNKQLARIDRQRMREMLVKSRESLEESDFSRADLTDRCNRLLGDTGRKPGVLCSVFRIATTGEPSSPGLAETLSVLGKDKSLDRLDKSLQLLT
jgi:glutamyl-tRNA synthetase